jgi:hypothetical protein
MLKQMTEESMPIVMQETCKLYSLHVDMINAKLFSLICLKIIYSLSANE